MKIIFLALFSLFSHLIILPAAQAAIPRTSMILQRTTENAGRGIYQIDLEIQFPNGQESTIVRETWMIEDSNNMKVHITGVKDYKDQVSTFISVNNGNRSLGKDLRKASSDLFERFFAARSGEGLNGLLSAEKITPSSAHLAKPLRSLKDVDFSQEPFIRLSRTNGIIAYALGAPADPDNKESTYPGIWIEQDQFFIRKLRLNSGIEIIADKYSTYTQGLNYPRTRVVRWAGQQIIIQTLSISPKTKAQFEAFGQKIVSKPESLSVLPNAAYIEDFYKRFR